MATDRLTQEAMEAAHCARRIDLDPDAGPQDDARYDLGKRVLERFTLSYSPRYQRGTPHPEILADVVGWINVNAGHIASAEAQRLALFRLRS